MPGIVILLPDGPGELAQPAVVDGVAALLLSGVLLLEVLVDPVGPLPDAPDVDGEGVVDLGGRADGERVPLEPGDRIGVTNVGLKGAILELEVATLTWPRRES